MPSLGLEIPITRSLSLKGEVGEEVDVLRGRQEPGTRRALRELPQPLQSLHARDARNLFPRLKLKQRVQEIRDEAHEQVRLDVLLRPVPDRQYLDRLLRDPEPAFDGVPGAVYLEHFLRRDVQRGHQPVTPVQYLLFLESRLVQLPLQASHPFRRRGANR